MDRKGTMAVVNGEFAGIDRFLCRDKIIAKLKEEDLLIRTEEHLHGNGYCYRCKTLLEPYPLEQWYLKTDEMIEPAIQLVENGEIDIKPESYKNIFCDWMRNLKKRKLQRENWWEGSCVAVQMGFSSNKDWCISRQIWWGHKIPAWECMACRRYTVSIEMPQNCFSCGKSAFVQEDDVLDMWFSCALWPLTVMGWPEDTDHMAYFFPQNLVVTGYDVFYFWVVPTIMLIYELSGRKPYDRALLHGLICDRNGKKMSKSFGNVINPNDIINKYGADTLRLTLISKVSRSSEDIRIAEEDFIDSRKKIEKIWDQAYELEDLTHQYGMMAKDKEIHEAEQIFEQIERQVAFTIEDYDFKSAVDLIFSCFFDNVDENLEFIKKRIQTGNFDLATILKKMNMTKNLFRKILIMLHPFIPFVTEELYNKFNYSNKSILEIGWPSSVSLS